LPFTGMTWPPRAVGRAPVRRLLARCEPLAARISSRVAPGWLFSFSAAVGLSVIALGAVATGTVVEDVTDGDGVAVLDRPVAAFVAAHRSGALTVVIRAVSAAGGPVVLAVVTVAAGVLAGVLWQSWGPVVVAVVTTAGSVALAAVFKQVLGRPRPPLAGAVVAADGYAFPSAHAAAAVAALGVLAYLGTARLRSWAGRVATWAVAAALAALVGVSRVAGLCGATTGPPGQRRYVAGLPATPGGRGRAPHHRRHCGRGWRAPRNRARGGRPG
jgi:membrane-associated phospholipid phosphatase